MDAALNFSSAKPDDTPATRRKTTAMIRLLLTMRKPPAIKLGRGVKRVLTGCKRNPDRQMTVIVWSRFVAALIARCLHGQLDDEKRDQSTPVDRHLPGHEFAAPG